LTVTEQGTAENARVLGGVEESLERVSLDTVKEWKFKPAIGEDGKPFPARVEIEVTFRLLRP
jgi:TonB family protein